jgi:hypothetical protein
MTLAQLVAAAVHRSAPRLLCLTCLAAEEGVSEHDVRTVALTLAVRGGLQLARCVCSRCQCTCVTLVVEEVV